MDNVYTSIYEWEDEQVDPDWSSPPAVDYLPMWTADLFLEAPPVRHQASEHVKESEDLAVPVPDKKSSVKIEKPTVKEKAKINPEPDPPVSPGFNMQTAQWSSKLNSYALRPFTMASQDCFALKPTTIMSGRYKGHQAMVFVSVDTNHFRLMDLPAEIRNMIYKCVLTKGSNHIQVCQTRYRFNDSYWTPQNTKGTHYSRDPNMARPKQTRIPVDLLRVSKKVHEEARAVLYGSNTFWYTSLRSLSTFLAAVGSNIAYLREVEVWLESDDYVRRTTLTASRQLMDAPGLRHLRIELSCDLHDESVMRKLSIDLKPLLKALYRRERSVAGVFEIVAFGTAISRYKCDEFGGEHHRAEPEPCPDCQKVRESVVEDFRGRLMHAAAVYLGKVRLTNESKKKGSGKGRVVEV